MTDKKLESKEEVKEEVKLVKLDLACGDNKTPGFLGIDCAKTESVDLVMDLTKIPFALQDAPLGVDNKPKAYFDDNSVDEIVCNHYAEHTPDLMKFMDECYRILKPGAKMTIVSPYYASMRCWQDPTHTRAISEASFLYFNKQWRDQNKLSHYPIKSDFDFVYGYNMNPEWVSRSDESKAFAIRHYINVVNDIIVTLTKREDGKL